MKPAWLAKVPPAWRARMVRMGFNLHPAFRGTGGRVEHVSHDLSHIRIRLPLTWRTRNIVGSLYGGSLFAVIPYLSDDPPVQARATGAVAQMGDLGSTLGPPVFATAIAGLGGLGLVLPLLVFALLGWSLATWGIGRHQRAVV